MAENEEKSLYEKYEKMAVFIRPYVHTNLISTYELYIRGRQPELYIYENYIKASCPVPPDTNTAASKKPVTLEDIIAVCAYIALSKENLDHAIRTYRENRRVYKRNWFNSIREEIESPTDMRPKNPQLLRKYAESNKMLALMDRSLANDMTVEEIMQAKYRETDNWRTDTTAPITDFFFLPHKPVKTVANGFINDITLETLTIIQNEFRGSIEGFNVNVPTDLTDHPIFSFRSTHMEFEPELLGNELNFLNRYTYENEETGVEGDITVKFSPDVDLPDTITKKALPQVIKRYQINLHQRELDMKDREIMTQLFNMINGETLNLPSIVVDLREFTRRIYNIKVPKRRHYMDIGSRLEKLKNYDYTIRIRNKDTGELIETTSLGLLNYLHINYEENFFQYTPSDQWVRTYIQKKYISILTDSYNSIESPQTRGIMIILQQERLAEHTKNSRAKILTLKYFRLHMKLQRMGNAALTKELSTHLSYLKDGHTVIKDFEFVNKGSAVRIEFLPLTTKELLAYGFNAQGLTDHSGIVDAEYVEVPDSAYSKKEK